MKKICCFCQKWASGGIETFLYNTLMEMDLEDISVHIVTECLEESIYTEPLEHRGVKFFQLSGSTRNFTANFKAFSDLLQHCKYDVVHLNIFQGMSLYYAKMAQSAQVPLIIAHSHGAGLRNSPTKPVKLMIHRLCSRLWQNCATDLWACSQNAARFMFSPAVREDLRLTIVPNGININKFRFSGDVRSKVRAELHLENQFVIGTVGRLSSEKNQEFLLDVFARVCAKCPTAHLLLVGDGELRPALEHRAAALNIEQKTTFLGTSSRVQDLMCAMDLFAFPSLTEGLGIAMIEAQANGLPSVCSDGVPEEAAVTELVRRIPLQSGPEFWSDALLAEYRFHTARADWADQIQAHGFDIRTVSRHIEKKYMG